jgi:hypothetical protein
MSVFCPRPKLTLEKSIQYFRRIYPLLGYPHGFPRRMGKVVLSTFACTSPKVSRPSSTCMRMQTRNGTRTTGIWLFVECHILCRVFYFGHSTNKLFAECHPKTLGKRKHSAKRLFDEYFIFDNTRQRALCRVSQIQHSAKSSLSSVFSPGKDTLKIIF